MTHRVSNSELRSFRRCRRRWWLSYVRKLELARPDVAGPRSLGTRVHLGLEAYYGADDPNPTVAYDAVDASLAADLARLEAFKDAEQAASRPFDVLGATDEARASADLARIMLEGYFEWIAAEAVDANLEIIAAEEELEVPLLQVDGEPWHLIGKLDQRVRRTDSGFLAFRDFKTVGNLTDLPRTIALNEQGLTYNVLLRLATGEHVDGMLVTMLRKVKRTARAKPPFYGQAEARWNSETLNSYVARLHGIVHDLARTEALLRSGVDHRVVAYPNPTNDCSWDCDFYPVCTMLDDGSRAEAMLVDLYRVHDPLARYADKTRETE